MPCNRPSHADMKRIKNDYFKKKNSYLSESFNILYKDQNLVFHPNSVSKSRKTMAFGWINKNCPKDDYANPCPHYYALDVDDLRIPKVLLQAECRCTECIQSNWFGSNKNHHTGMGCHKIYHYSLVMRATHCSNGTMQFEEGFEAISVGCACRRLERIRMRS